MFIEQDKKNGGWYIYRRTKSHKGTKAKATYRDWFLIKYMGNGCCIAVFHKGTSLSCPTKFVGKRVRLRVEFIDDGER